MRGVQQSWKVDRERVCGKQNAPWPIPTREMRAEVSRSEILSDGPRLLFDGTRRIGIIDDLEYVP
jgi:hypothetical protein